MDSVYPYLCRRDLFLPLLTTLVEREVEATKALNTLFRQNSRATKLIKAFLASEGARFLKARGQCKGGKVFLLLTALTDRYSSADSGHLPPKRRSNDVTRCERGGEPRQGVWAVGSDGHDAVHHHQSHVRCAAIDARSGSAAERYCDCQVRVQVRA